MLIPCLPLPLVSVAQVQITCIYFALYAAYIVPAASETTSSVSLKEANSNSFIEDRNWL